MAGSDPGLAVSAGEAGGVPGDCRNPCKSQKETAPGPNTCLKHTAQATVRPRTDTHRCTKCTTWKQTPWMPHSPAQVRNVSPRCSHSPVIYPSRDNTAHCLTSRGRTQPKARTGAQRVESPTCTPQTHAPAHPLKVVLTDLRTHEHMGTHRRTHACTMM